MAGLGNILTARNNGEYPAGGGDNDLLIDQSGPLILIWNGGKWVPVNSGDPIQEGGVMIPKYTYVTIAQMDQPVTTWGVTDMVWVNSNINNAPTLQLVDVNMRYRVASSSGTLQIEQLSSGVAPGSGTSVLTATMNLAGTPNTGIQGSIGTNNQFPKGRALGFVFGGTLTGLLGCVVTLTFQRVS